MKGIVFSEFIEMVETAFSPELADRIIVASDLPSGGAYTSVGTYDHAEMLTLVRHLAAATGVPADTLVKSFGHHLATRFTHLYPDFFAGVDSTFDFLETIERHVHVEVRKLYPDAELPTFTSNRAGDGRMYMLYQSRRPFADLAEGLIQGCAEYFGERVHLARHDRREGGYYLAEFELEQTAS